MKIPRLQNAVFLGALALAAWPLLTSGPKSAFNLEGFGRLPLLDGGRVKPIDSFARNSLLSVRSKQNVSMDGQRLSAVRWLLDASFKPEAADTYPSFVIDDPEVLGLLGLEQSKGRYFAYWQIEPKREDVQKQAANADVKPSGGRSRFDEAVLALERRLTLYERIKNTFMLSGSGDPSRELAAFADLLPGATRSMHAAKPSKKDQETIKALTEMLQRYNFMAQISAFKAIPPQLGEPAEAWANTGEALVRPARGLGAHPAVASFAQMGSAYRSGDGSAFNAALAAYAQWLAENRPTEVRMAHVEALFNKSQPFISGIALYIIALLLVFAAWALGR